MIDFNDPRLTAFALGELDAAEHRELAAAVQASPELQREVAAIQQSADRLQASLKTESCPSLTDEQRCAIVAQSHAPGNGAMATGESSADPMSATSGAWVGLPTAPISSHWSLRRSVTFAVTGCLLLVVLGSTAVFTFNFSPLSLAHRDHPESPGVNATVEPSSDETVMGGFSVDREIRSPSSSATPAERDSYGAFASGGEDGYGGRGRGGQAPTIGRDVQMPAADFDIRFGGESELEGRNALLEEVEEERLGVERMGEATWESPRRSAGEQLDAVLLPATPSPFSAGQTPNSRRNRGASQPAASNGPETRPAVVDESAPIAASGFPDESAEFRLPMLLKQQAESQTRGDAFSEDGASVDDAKAKASRSLGEREVKESLDLAKTGAKDAGKASTWRRARATPNASQLMIGDQDGLPLEGMQVNVLVDGFRARVLLDLYYYNNRGRRLEGDFKLRLPNEASLYYFAFGQSAYEYRPMVDQLASKGFLSGDLLRAASLDPLGIRTARQESWSDVKEARVVPREKAAHAYSETVRRRVDPALVEWSGAGVFNARVFPLMPNKLHRVVVGYDVNLQQVGDDLVYALDLPADQGECVVDLNVSALPGVTAEVTPAARPFVSSGRAYYTFKDPADQAIHVHLRNAGSMLLTGTDEQAGAFFATRMTPDLPADQSSANSSRAMFLVDTSLSSRPEKFNVWLEMLEAVLTENRDSIDEFAVLFFNVESRWWQPGYRKNNAKQVAQLIEDCRTLSLEGATDLRQALRQAVNPDWAKETTVGNAPRPDLFLLSDGAVTWGEMNVHRLSQTLQQSEFGPLFAYQTGLTGTAVGMLEHLTRETGGAVFSVVNASEIPQVARAHRQRPWQLVDVTLPGGSDVLVAGRPKFIYPGQTLTIVGRGQPDAEATLRIRRGAQQEVVELKLDRALESTLAPRAYGQVSVGQLEDLGSQVEDVAIAYARHFRVTGQTCSLLMLESEADYQRFKIKPEEDALLVRTSPAAELIAVKLDELAEQLGDAKTALIDWLHKLERAPGLQFKMPAALRLVVERLPGEAFEIETGRLVCSQPSNEDTPQAFSRLLDSGRLDYATVTQHATRRFEQDGAADALRTLSSLVENSPGDPVLARDVAFSALEWGLGGQAVHLLKRVADLRPYEPQTYQALSMCFVETGNADLAMIYYEVALNATWHNRYLDVKQVVGVEYLDLLRRIERGDLASHAREYAVARLETMRRRAPVDTADLVVTMMWNTDRTDVDLHVIEPTGEECYYEHPRTAMGGRMTRDVTEGFGPEMYTLPKAKAGDYRILANYFGSDANRTSLRSKVYVTIYRNYGDPKRQLVEKQTITLADQKEKRELVTVKVKR